MRFPWLPVLLGCFLLGGKVTLRGAPPLEEIIARVLERDEAMGKGKEAFRFDLDLTNQKLRRDNSVLREDLIKVVIRPGDNGAFQQIVKQAGEAQESGAAAAQAKKDVDRAQGAMKSMNLKKLAPRFDISLEGEGTELGVPCWILRFTPKKGQPYKSREEKVINQLSGRFWVAKSDYSIVRSSGEITAPVPVAWMLASMKELVFDYQTKPLPGVGRVPSRFDLLFDVETPINNVRRRQTSVMSNYVKEPGR